MLSYKTYQNQGICYVTIAYCYVTKMFVTRNIKKVGQACSKPKTLNLKL